jgi:hypothetical protein
MITKNIATNFHNDSLIKATGKYVMGKWVLTRLAKREIDYQFLVHYHPYVDALIEKLNTDGLEAMLDVNWQAGLIKNLGDTSNATDPAIYTPGDTVIAPFPEEDIDVSDNGAYSIYNWELFFHAPLIIAIHLSQNQRFAEAQRWFHFIFDPTSTDSTPDPAQKFWKFLRFREETKAEFIQDMLNELSNPVETDLKKQIETSIQAWRDNPFQPFVIARGRYLAFQLNVIMKYLDNLLAWGDNLYRQDTIETLNEATQIYVLAANILGPKPQQIPMRGATTPKTYAQLKASGIDKFGNALVDMENDFPFNVTPTTTTTSNEDAVSSVFGIGRSLYFCVPQNSTLLGYWDQVADRLFKLRHCMNFDGVVQQLPLFDPPIDPGMLVKAVASGLDIASIVNNINQPVSNIRGGLLLQKALELCSEVRAMGNSLLAALEKGDAEHVGLLRQQYEVKVLNLAQDVKFLQWKEAEAATEALIKSRNTVFERYRHYKMILGTATSDLDPLKSVTLARQELTADNYDAVYDAWVSQYGQDITDEAYRVETSVGGLMEFAGNAVTSVFGGQLGQTLPLNKNENAELNIFLPTSDTFNELSMILQLATPILGLIPQFNAHGTPLGVGAAVGFGGVQLAKASKEGAKISKDVANAFESSANRASKLAGYYRRAEDYVLQANLAGSDLMQFGRQIISSLIREQITKKEYDNHVRQIDAAQGIQDFLSSKFTQEELYTWMQGELSKSYFDCYKFAFDTAKRAEQTLKYELMRSEFDSTDFIQFGYWDSSRKGLLAGEALYLDLKRLELAYHDQNLREYEITRHVSLVRLDAMALLQLKATGSCQFSIPEWLYDLDMPGQYMRRIKTVSVSIPCIAGPYAGVHAKLSLLRSSIRVSSILGDDYARSTTSDDDRFRDFNGAIQSMVTSTAQNDSGLFELNLHDERYLPFEGAGAISSWRLDLSRDIPQFDFETIADVIVHVKFTAREAGALKTAAVAAVKETLQTAGTLLQLTTLNYDFSQAWYKFTSAASDADRKLDLAVGKDRFPYWVNPMGMDDNLVATFCCIDWQKNKLTLATATITLAGDATAGWTASVDNSSPVFPFLKKNLAGKVYMALSFAMKS